MNDINNENSPPAPEGDGAEEQRECQEADETEDGVPAIDFAALVNDNEMEARSSAADGRGSNLEWLDNDAVEANIIMLMTDLAYYKLKQKSAKEALFDDIESGPASADNKNNAKASPKKKKRVAATPTKTPNASHQKQPHAKLLTKVKLLPKTNLLPSQAKK